MHEMPIGSECDCRMNDGPPERVQVVGGPAHEHWERPGRTYPRIEDATYRVRFGDGREEQVHPNRLLNCKPPISGPNG